MILRKNLDLFNTIKALAGVNDFTTEETQNLVDLTNRRLTMAYNTSPMWDRYVVVAEKRTVSDFVVGGTSLYDGPYYKLGKYEYTTGKFGDFFVPINQTPSLARSACFFQATNGEWRLGALTYTKDPLTDIVTSVGGITYSSQVDEDSSGNPIQYGSPTEVVEWDNASVSATRLTAKQVIPYDQTYEALTSSNSNRESQETINDFIRIHDSQSFLNRSATEYDFYADSFGANVLNGRFTNNEAYVTYKKPILDDSGKVIDSLTSSINQQIPNEFFNYTAHAVYADFLRMDGQHDKAAFEEQKADMFLATELERIDIINNNNSLNHKISTYVNRSTR
jgi:hypothetical protein